MAKRRQPEDERLLGRARIVVIGVIVGLLVIVTLHLLFGPPVHDSAASVLVVLVPSLVGALGALFGIESILNRR